MIRPEGGDTAHITRTVGGGWVRLACGYCPASCQGTENGWGEGALAAWASFHGLDCTHAEDRAVGCSHPPEMLGRFEVDVCHGCGADVSAEDRAAGGAA